MGGISGRTRFHIQNIHVPIIDGDCRCNAWVHIWNEVHRPTVLDYVVVEHGSSVHLGGNADINILTRVLYMGCINHR